MHCAALYSFAPRDRAAMHAVNVDATASLMMAAYLAGVERGVLTSSSATLGHAHSGYHRSKLEQEHAAFSSRLPIVALLPTAPVGPGDAKPTPTGRLVLDFLRGKIVAKAPGHGGMNLVAVEDVAHAHVAALDRGNRRTLRRRRRKSKHGRDLAHARGGHGKTDAVVARAVRASAHRSRFRRAALPHHRWRAERSARRRAALARADVRRLGTGAPRSCVRVDAGTGSARTRRGVVPRRFPFDRWRTNDSMNCSRNKGLCFCSLRGRLWLRLIVCGVPSEPFKVARLEAPPRATFLVSLAAGAVLPDTLRGIINVKFSNLICYLRTSATAALLAGCAGSQPAIGGFGVASVNNAGATVARAAIVDVTGGDKEEIFYMSPPTTMRSRFTRIPGVSWWVLGTFNGAGGLCVDKAGDVFVTSFYDHAVYEYAHGSTKQLAALGSPYSVNACSVDPKTQNVAASSYLVRLSFSIVGSVATVLESTTMTRPYTMVPIARTMIAEIFLRMAPAVKTAALH